MKDPSLIQKIGRKKSDPSKIAELVIKSPSLIQEVLEGMSASEPAVKYTCEKVVRMISERQPDLLYPHFDFLVAMLDCQNSILKWGALRSLANLARIDVQNKIDAILDKYVSPIPGPVMITAATAIAGCATIAKAKPRLAARISQEILKVDRAAYKTPECRNVAIGHAIASFSQFFEFVPEKRPIVSFVKKQLGNTRPPVRKRAEKFLKKLRIS
jgi:hypothetical protein